MSDDNLIFGIIVVVSVLFVIGCIGLIIWYVFTGNDGCHSGMHMDLGTPIYVFSGKTMVPTYPFAKCVVNV